MYYFHLLSVMCTLGKYKYWALRVLNRGINAEINNNIAIAFEDDF